LNEDVDLRNLDVKRLRSTLVADGVILA
jgi:hypothetical protein